MGYNQYNMSSNRLMYDTNTSKTNIKQNTAPLSYLLNSSYKINRKTNINNFSEKKNCINNYNNNNKFNLYNTTRLIDDKNDIDYQVKQSKFPGKYMTSNYHSCECKAENISKVHIVNQIFILGMVMVGPQIKDVI